MKYTIRNWILFAIIALLSIACGREDFGKQAEGGSLKAESPAQGDRNDGAPDENPDEPGNDDLNNASPPLDPVQAPGQGFESGIGIAANSALSFKAYRAMRSANENVVIAPLGLTRSFSIASLAASDAAVQESIMQILETDANPGLLNESVAQTIEAVRLNAGMGQLSLVPSLWAQDGSSIQQAFLEDIAYYHDMGVQLVDFGSTGARDQINTWFRNRTDGYVVDAVAPRAFPEDTRFAFIDASYFIGNWVYPFDSDAGYDTTFQGSRQNVSVRMMRLEETLQYSASSDSEWVVLPYDNGFSLIAILPQDGAFETVENNLSESWLTERLQAADFANVDLAFPRVEASGRFDLQQNDQSLNLDDAARQEGAFANAGESLLLGNILQRTTIRFEDTQTTAVSPNTGMDPTAETDESAPISMVFDRPFIFVLRDSATGAIVLIGRVGQPRAI